MINESPKIEYWTSVSGLSYLEDVRPAPLKQFIPSWWYDVPRDDEKRVVHCPSFPDVFSSAYVMPAWCDTKITINELGDISWETPDSRFIWQFHSNEQFLNYSPKFLREKVHTVLKPLSPWYLRTPVGYSVYQMPVFYDFNEDFSTIPGIIHTDMYHETNPQIMLFSQKKEFIIKRGTPLVVHFPFKREKFNLEVREQTHEDFIHQSKSGLIASTKFFGGYKKIFKDLKERITNEPNNI